MTVPMPRPGPDDEQPPGGAPGPDAGYDALDGRDGPQWAWAPGRAETGPVPASELPASELPGTEPDSWAAGLPAGLDYLALLNALAASGALGGSEEEQDAELAERDAAEAEGRLERCDPAVVAAVAVEHMEPGPAQAGWLGVAAATARGLEENELAGVAIAARRLASWAQSAELAAVAQITARAAAADPKIGVEADGRPTRVCRDAVGQVEMALRLTHYGAEDWADLAVMLTWRLAATGAALAAGRVDLDRARKIAEATSVLPEELARAVEEQILPKAPGLTKAQLAERLGRAVIAADPAGAERRRQQAERHADVRLYDDDDQTASLVASKQPQILAAAAHAKITAMARARKAAGLPGSLGFHRSQVMMGLLLNTLPPTPPADGAPPDQPPPGDTDTDTGPGDTDTGPADTGPGDTDTGPGDTDTGPADTGPGDTDTGLADTGPGDTDTGPGDTDTGPADTDTGPGDTDTGPADTGGGPDDIDLGGDPHDTDPSHDPGPVAGPGPADSGPWEDLPTPRDEDAPPDDGLDDDGLDAGQDAGWDPAEEDDDPLGTRPVPAWPTLGVIPAALARHPAGPADGRPVPGLLDVLLPWATLAGLGERPGTLGRIGPITAAQARVLALAAEDDSGAQWRVIVTDAAGQAIAVTRIRRRARRDGSGMCRDGPGGARDGPPPGSGMVARVTVTIPQKTITAAARAPSGPRQRGSPGGPGPRGGIAAAALRVGARALDSARARAAADQAAGGCAHTDESPSYRPPPRLREHVIARDVTCRNPSCGQPAWRGDLDHTIPWDDGGRTCSCDLGGACRRDHQLKQHPRWKLAQIRPGWFTWTAPGGRTYQVGPDIHPV